MKKMITSINSLLQNVRAEKDKAVKNQDYDEAAILRNWEKDLMGIESAMQSHRVDRATPEPAYTKCGYCQKPYRTFINELGWEVCQHCEGM